MDKVRVRPLRPYEKKKLHRLKRQKANAVNSRNARVVLLSRGGVRNAEIARLCGCSPQWVRVLIHRFNGGGVDAISWHPRLCGQGKPGRFKADVLQEIAEVDRGEAIFSPATARRLSQFFSRTPTTGPPEHFPELTDRERDILGLIVAGHGNAQIAERLHLTPKTVRNYVSNILAKLQVHDRAQAIVKARDAGFPPPSS